LQPFAAASVSRPAQRARFDSFGALAQEAVFDAFDFRVPAPRLPTGMAVPEPFDAFEGPVKEPNFESADFHLQARKAPSRILPPEQEERPRSVRRFATTLIWVCTVGCLAVLALAWRAHLSGGPEHKPALTAASRI
jgi:hypothetical protein